MTTVQEIAAIARNHADALGIQKFDIYGATIEETSVQVDQGEPKQVKASNRASITVRVWSDAGQVGITSTTDIDENGLSLALKTAQEASAFGVKEKSDNLSDAEKKQFGSMETIQTEKGVKLGDASVQPALNKVHKEDKQDQFQS